MSETPFTAFNSSQWHLSHLISMTIRCAWQFVWSSFKGFWSYAPFSKWLYINIIRHCSSNLNECLWFALCTHAQETKNRSFPQRVPVVRSTRQLSMLFRDVTDTNQSESHSRLQQLRFTRNYMGAWRTWRRPPTSSLLLDWSCRWTRSRRRRSSMLCCLVEIGVSSYPHWNDRWSLI